MTLDPGTLRTLAARAGEETGESYPGAGRWILRFVELVEAHIRKDAPDAEVPPEQIQEALAFYAKRENWARDVVMSGKHCAHWKQGPALLDKGSLARLTLMGGGAGTERGPA